MKYRVAGLLLATMASMASAAPNLVKNGGFESTTVIPRQNNPSVGGTGQLGYNITADHWNSTGYNFLEAPGTADNLATAPQGVYGALPLYGPQNGHNNGLPLTSPSGGKYIAADGAFDLGAISQTIGGLVAGKTYAVSFEWAAAQQYNYDSDTTERWLVSLDNQSLPNGVDDINNPTLNVFTRSTAVLHNPNQGFQPWRTTTFDFVARDTTQVLSFLAVGTPQGKPPFSLIDNVTLKAAAVPEPASWAMMIVGFGAVGGAMRRHAKRTALAA